MAGFLLNLFRSGSQIPEYMSDKKKTIAEPAREIPVLMETDVVVVGGGTTGPFAAIAAARQGKRVVLIERFGSLGGTLTLGLNTKPSGALLGGLPLEVWTLARSVGGAGPNLTVTTKTGDLKIASPCEPEIMKILLTKLCVDSGVQILFETFASTPIVENGVMKGVVIEGKGGRQFVGAQVVIDCSADADMATQANVPFTMGSGGSDIKMQPVSMYFTMSNVDIGRLVAWARTSDDIPDRTIPDTEEGYAYGLWLVGFKKTLKKFQAETGIQLRRERITLKTANGQMYVNATRVLDIDVFSPVQATEALVECYRQIEALLRFFRECIPGFEKASILQIAPVLGVRETRHVHGEYTLTGEDAIEGRRFDDSIAADCSALDIHDPSGVDGNFQSLRPYEIPYRCLVPLNVEQLLVAGRCISADQIAHGRSRNMPACMATGQGAGVAAAVAIDDGVTVRNVSVQKVQKILRSMGMPLHAEDIV